MVASESTMEVDGVRFRYGTEFGTSTDEAFFLAKPADLTHDYLALMKGAAGNIVELGIFQGGSAALTALVARPKRIVVIDRSEPIEVLDRFVAGRGIGDVLRPHYGVDQGDRAELARIMAAEFGDEPLDLVVDDASHLLAPTRASFEELFPRLRPGSRYLIEDWHWELKYGLLSLDTTEPPDAAERLDRLLSVTDDGNRILATLGIELIAAHVAAPDVIPRVTFDGWWIVVERGPAEIDPAGFRLKDVHRGLSSIIRPDDGEVPDLR